METRQELTVESALKELREMFQSYPVMVSHLSRADGTRRVEIQANGGGWFFGGSTLAEAMQKVREWRKANQ